MIHHVVVRVTVPVLFKCYDFTPAESTTPPSMTAAVHHLWEDSERMLRSSHSHQVSLHWIAYVQYRFQKRPSSDSSDTSTKGPRPQRAHTGRGYKGAASFICTVKQRHARQTANEFLLLTFFVWAMPVSSPFYPAGLTCALFLQTLLERQNCGSHFETRIHSQYLVDFHQLL